MVFLTGFLLMLMSVFLFWQIYRFQLTRRRHEERLSLLRENRVKMELELRQLGMRLRLSDEMLAQAQKANRDIGRQVKALLDECIRTIIQNRLLE